MKIILLLVTVILYSCNNNIMRNEIDELRSKPIILPEMTMTLDGRDSLLTNFMLSKLKFIVYYDSVGCSSCNVNKMDLWKPYIKYARTYNDKIKFYFIFRPSEVGIVDLRNALMINSLNYPILIDGKGAFEKLNPHFPKNKNLHTFLLDENNNVILIGNPLYNKKLEKLFYQKTQELLNKSD